MKVQWRTALVQAKGHSASHEGETSNESTGGRWRRCRGWPLRVSVLAVSAGLVLVAAACSSGSSAGSAGSSSTGGSVQSQQLAYAQCMRSHGLPDFPDPSAGGGFGSAGRSEQNNPSFAAADSACRHLLGNGGTGSKQQQDLAVLLQLAQCMRSHGVPDYPDPNPNVNPRTALIQAGVDPNTPQFQAASQTCARLHPLSSASRRGGRS